MIGETDDDTLRQNSIDGIECGRAGFFVDNIKYLMHGLSARLRVGPARQSFGKRIEQHDHGVHVNHDDRVANRRQRCGKPQFRGFREAHAPVAGDPRDNVLITRRQELQQRSRSKRQQAADHKRESESGNDRKAGFTIQRRRALDPVFIFIADESVETMADAVHDLLALCIHGLEIRVRIRAEAQTS